MKSQAKKDGIDFLVEHWLTDGEFREAFRLDARSAAHRRGIDLDEIDWRVVGALGMMTSPIRALDPCVRIEREPFKHHC